MGSAIGIGVQKRHCFTGTLQCALAFGPEGGFTDYERAQLLDKHWVLAHLGPRVLRLETAVLAASAIASEHLKFWEEPTQSPLSRIYG